MTNYQALTSIGWSPFFQQQITLEEWDTVIPARVVEKHKSIISVVTENENFNIYLTPNMPCIVVGDWLLLDHKKLFCRLLERKTCFKRKSAGTEVKQQLISANVDTAFIVSSLNDDFNLSRIERYLSLAYSAGAEPVIVLTKSDLIENPQSWIEQVHELDKHLPVIAINALESGSTDALNEWLSIGKTVVILGSSGVGKSTLTNSLLNEHKQATQGIREDDDKGRHTTTNRSLLSIANGAMVIDTPGMRELQLADCHDGIASAFADIEQLVPKCRFSDCKHIAEPGCAVLAAVSTGKLDPRRLKNYLKLMKEEEINSASLCEKRAKDKALGKFYKRTLLDAYKIKGRT